MPSTEDIHSICMAPSNKLPTRERIELLEEITETSGLDRAVHPP
jgi:hypothetical protein